MKNAIKPGTTASFNDWDVPGLNFAKTQYNPYFLNILNYYHSGGNISGLKYILNDFK